MAKVGHNVAALYECISDRRFQELLGVLRMSWPYAVADDEIEFVCATIGVLHRRVTPCLKR